MVEEEPRETRRSSLSDGTIAAAVSRRRIVYNTMESSIRRETA